MKTEKKTLNFKERLADIKKRAAEKPRLEETIAPINESPWIGLVNRNEDAEINREIPDSVQRAGRSFSEAVDRMADRAIAENSNERIQGIGSALNIHRGGLTEQSMTSEEILRYGQMETINFPRTDVRYEWSDNQWSRTITPYSENSPNPAYRDPNGRAFNPEVEMHQHTSQSITSSTRNSVSMHLDIEEVSVADGLKVIEINAYPIGRSIRLRSRSFSQDYASDQVNQSIRRMEMSNVLKLLGERVIDILN